MTFRCPTFGSEQFILDTLEDIKVLHVCGFRIFFFSFQWLSWNQPGPGLLIAEAIQGFKALGTFTVFFSYPWLSWGQAGPDAIQFNAMTESL